MLNKIDKVLHDQIHSSMMERSKHFQIIQDYKYQTNYDNYKLKIEGVIADVGCGGYFEQSSKFQMYQGSIVQRHLQKQ